MNIQSNDDARTNARSGVSQQFNRPDSDDGERSCTAEQPTAFSGAEEEYSDWDFALTCFVGTMDGTLSTELQAVAADPRVKRIPKDEAVNERARTLYNTLTLLTTKGPRKMVREIPDQNGYEAYRSLVLRYGSRDAHGETTLLIKVMNFNFGDIDAMETKFEELNLLIKEHDDTSGFDNIPDTISERFLWQERQNHCEPYCKLNSQSYEMRQATNQYLKARKGFKLIQKGKGKGNDKGKGKPKGKSKGKT